MSKKELEQQYKNIVGKQIEEQEEDELQRAIMASLEESKKDEKEKNIRKLLKLKLKKMVLRFL